MIDAKVSIEILKKFNKQFLKDYELKEGDHLLVETAYGTKEVYVNKTSKGRLFVEASETSKFEDVVIVEPKEIGSDYLIIPSFVYLIELVLRKDYKIVFYKNKKEIYELERWLNEPVDPDARFQQGTKVTKILEKEELTKVDLMKLLLK